MVFIYFTAQKLFYTVDGVAGEKLDFTNESLIFRVFWPQQVLTHPWTNSLINS